MYTREDYIKDKYISENGGGFEQIHAKRRCIAYENGSDAEDIEYIGSEMETKERISKHNKRRAFFLPYAIISTVLGFVSLEMHLDSICIFLFFVTIVLWFLALD